MLEVRLDHMLQLFVEHMLPCGSEHALWVALDARVCDYSGLPTKEVSTAIHFIFEHRGRSVKVWAAESKDRWKLPSVDKFMMYSDHDSCWRIDGMRINDAAYFRMAKECNPRKAPKNLTQHVYVDRIAKVSIQYVNDTDNTYNKVLTEIKLLGG